MKLSLVLFLTVAIFASVSYAYPEPQPDPLAEAVAEAFAEPAEIWNKIKKFVGKVYSSLCKDEEGNNKCKAWAKENITSENFKKFLSQFEEEINGYCAESKNIIIKGVCKLYQNYMKKED